MKYINIIIIVLILLVSIDCFGQKITKQNVDQVVTIDTTQPIKNKIKVGAFGEIIDNKDENSEKGKGKIQYFIDDDFIDVCGNDELVEPKIMVEPIREISKMRSLQNIQPPKNKSFLFHSAKEITNESGFYIQLLKSNDILEKEHSIYQEFGNLRVLNNIEDVYCYLIGNFKSKETVEFFLNNVILPRYPNARIIELKEGNHL